jgi:hypothetical protein
MNVFTEPDRVRRSTAPEINERIDETIRETVQRFASASEAAISQRMGALEEEWDVERLLETNASSLALAGVLSAVAGHRRGLVLAGGVLAFLLWHATKGWCPPLPVLRRLGVRTRREIERERFVLKYLRGDFAGFTVERARAAPAELLAAMES